MYAKTPLRSRIFFERQCIEPALQVGPDQAVGIGVGDAGGQDRVGAVEADAQHARFEYFADPVLNPDVTPQRTVDKDETYYRCFAEWKR